MGEEMIDKDLCKIKVVGRMVDEKKVDNFGEELKTDSFVQNLKKSGAPFKSVAKIVKNEDVDLVVVPVANLPSFDNCSFLFFI